MNVQLRPGPALRAAPLPRAGGRSQLNQHRSQGSLSSVNSALQVPPRKGALLITVSKGWLLRPAPTSKTIIPLIRTAWANLISNSYPSNNLSWPFD